MSILTSAAGVTWDLSDLFVSYDDPALTAALDHAATEAEAFADIYRGTINVPGGPEAIHLREGLERLEALYDATARSAVFAGLLFAADTSKAEHRDLQQRVDQRLTAIHNQILFFDLEWLVLNDADAQRLLDDPILAPYRHYLHSARRYKPHTLSEPEERLLNDRDITGVQAWRQFYTELTSALSFPIELDGELQQVPLDSILNLLRHPQRSVRQQAHTQLYAVLGPQARTLAYIYNTLMQDQLTMNRLRHYPDPMGQRHLENQIEPQAVATMMEVVEQNYGIAQTYF